MFSKDVERGWWYETGMAKQIPLTHDVLHGLEVNSNDTKGTSICYH